MTREKLTETLKWAGRRLHTGALYVLAVVGGSSWDRDPGSWLLITFHLGAAAMFLAWAVRRSIGHWHEDQEDS